VNGSPETVSDAEVRKIREKFDPAIGFDPRVLTMWRDEGVSEKFQEFCRLRDLVYREEMKRHKKAVRGEIREKVVEKGMFFGSVDGKEDSFSKTLKSVFFAISIQFKHVQR
jgi:hypothetical protein